MVPHEEATVHRLPEICVDNVTVSVPGMIILGLWI